MEEVIETFLEGVKSPSTTKSYRSDLAHFRGWFRDQYGRDPVIAEISHEVVAAYQASMKDSLSSNTVNRRLATLSSLLSNEGYHVAFPPRVPAAPKVLQWLKVDEVRSLLAAAASNRDPQDSIILRLMLSSGLSSEELAKLTWSDLNLAERTMRVRREDGIVMVPVGPGAADSLRMLRHHRESRWSLRREDMPDAVFQGLRDSLTASGISQRVGQCALRARLFDRANSKTLKTSFLKRLIESGASFPVVVRLAGNRVDLALLLVRDGQVERTEERDAGGAREAVDCLEESLSDRRFVSE